MGQVPDGSWKKKSPALNGQHPKSSLTRRHSGLETIFGQLLRVGLLPVHTATKIIAGALVILCKCWSSYSDDACCQTKCGSCAFIEL